jgi:hypothetical protein
VVWTLDGDGVIVGVTVGVGVFVGATTSHIVDAVKSP